MMGFSGPPNAFFATDLFLPELSDAGYVLCMLSDTALLTALYVILKRVNQNLALFAACLRLV
jgi:hypothetical protein